MGKRSGKRKIKKTAVIAGLVFITGLSLLLYPTVSDLWNAHHQSQAIATYMEDVSELEDVDYTEILTAARTYNASLIDDAGRYNPSEEDEALYESLLNIGGNGIMGYVEIPSIDVNLPIYHGTDAEVLQVAVGHIEGTSLPVGGSSTHCVISAHRGLPSAKLFTNLDQVKEGDVFYLKVLDEVLTYEVDQIRIVLPEEADDIDIIEGEDLCTLVTCTPYGINTHRLLVRGHRIDTVVEDNIRVSSDAAKIDTFTVSLAIGVPVICIWVVIMLVLTSKKQGDKEDVNKKD